MIGDDNDDDDDDEMHLFISKIEFEWQLKGVSSFKG
jgi:hypothetical protein